MNQTIPAILGIFCIIAVAFAGCTVTTGGNASSTTAMVTATPGITHGVTPVGTPIPSPLLEVTGVDAGRTVTVNQSSSITLKLAENPATGFAWILIVSPGLNVTNDMYLPSDATGPMAGTGGTRIWEIRAERPGVQTIYARSVRSWEQVAGNETSFSVTVNVR